MPLDRLCEALVAGVLRPLLECVIIDLRIERLAPLLVALIYDVAIVRLLVGNYRLE